MLIEVIEDYDTKLSYSSDSDALVGHKSGDTAFFDYEMHIAMNDERMITAAVVTTGEKSEGYYLLERIEKSEETGMEIETVTGDVAYSGKDNLQNAKLGELQLISKLNPVITDGNGQIKVPFDFNKNAGMFF